MKTLVVGIFFTLWSLAGSVWASPTLQVKGGQSTLAFSDDFLAALEPCDIASIKPGVTKQQGTQMRFPLAGGAIDLETGRGIVAHNGGLAISCFEGSNVVSLSNFTLNTTGVTPAITAIAVGDGNLLDQILAFVPGEEHLIEISANGKNVYLRKVDLLLTGEAAGLLNTELGTTLFFEGQLIGEVKTRMKLRKESIGKENGKGKDKGKKKEEECGVAPEGECEGAGEGEGEVEGEGEDEGEGEVVT